MGQRDRKGRSPAQRRTSTKTSQSHPRQNITPQYTNGSDSPTDSAPRPAENATSTTSPTTESRFTLEAALWILLLSIAVITRFWDLESRTVHHDESLHAYYSWVFATGDQPYVHDPLMHGPFLFHANALVYLLFGASDATSRYLPALFGVIIVGLPWLLRDAKFLGRWGALAAGFMLLISPAFLYYTRFIRHDPYTVAGSMLLCIAVFRYLEHPSRTWMLTAFATTAFLLTNHEIVFAIALAFVLVLWGALVLERLRPLIPVHLVAVALALLILLARQQLGWAPLPDIRWENAPPDVTRAFYSDLLTNPLVVTLLGLGAAFVIACVSIMRRTAKQRAAGAGYVKAIFGGSRPDTVAYGVYHALRDPAGLGIGVLIALAIFVGLFTTLFTNLRGLATATYAPDGTLLYWLGQQDVRRGDQPWFYFITEAVQYEWLAIFVGLSALGVTGYRLLRAAIGKKPYRLLLFEAFLAFWFVFLLLLLSWAGEKMPWLILHIACPAILLGARLVNEVVEGAIRWFREHRAVQLRGTSPRIAGGIVAGALVMLAAGWFLVAARLTSGGYVERDPGVYTRGVRPAALDDWWLLALPPLAGLAVIGGAIWWIGARRAAYATLIAAVVMMSAFQIHTGFRLSYLDGDTARDTLIYNTTGADVKQLTHDLTDMSELIYGDHGLRVAFDGCTQWPLHWYLRHLPNRQLINTLPEDRRSLAPVIIGVPEGWDTLRGCQMPEEIAGYTSQTYAFRVHEPEHAVYRQFAVAPELEPHWSAWGAEENPHDLPAVIRSVWSSLLTLTDPDGQQRAYRLVMYRELPQGLNVYEFKVYIRNDLLPYYNDIRYGA